MKNISIKILSLFVCLSFYSSVYAQQKEYKGEVSITPVRLEQVGDSLYVVIDFNFEKMTVNSRRSITYIPTLATSNVNKSLQGVTVKGRADYNDTRRQVALMSKAELELHNLNLSYVTIKGYKSEQSKSVRYSKAIPFESWMKEARLDIVEDNCGCGRPSHLLNTLPLVNSIQLEKIILPYDITPHVVYLQPEAEAIKKREIAGEAFLDFAVSRVEINSDYMNNPRELKKITDMMSEVYKDPSITVKGVYVVGYASPEGGLKINQQLSEGRAKSLVSYLTPLFNYPKNMYKVVFGGENWSGLRETISNSQVTYKDQVLAILDDNTLSNDARKNKLKRLSKGEPYRQMVKEYYPALRKAICKIDYEVKGFDVAEAKEVLKTRPQNLSLNEMYLVANTYDVGSTEFVDLFETAVKLFPDDVTANLNAASAALTRKDVTTAERYLKKIEGKLSTAQYHNTLGVMLMLKGEYERADEHLKIASKSELEVAKANLKELRNKLENIEHIKQQKR